MKPLIVPRKVSGLALAVVLVACSYTTDTVTATTSERSATPTGTAETTTPSGSVRTTDPSTTTSTTVPEDTWYEILVTGGQPVGGVLRIEVSVGGEVRLRVTSDTSDRVHIHGYDLLFDVGGSVPVEYTFTADIFGIFEIELEDTHTPIAELVVG